MAKDNEIKGSAKEDRYTHAREADDDSVYKGHNGTQDSFDHAAF